MKLLLRKLAFFVLLFSVHSNASGDELKAWKLNALRKSELPSWIEKEEVNHFSESGKVASMKGDLRVREDNAIFSRGDTFKLSPISLKELSKIINDFSKGKKGILANFPPAGQSGWCLIEAEGSLFVVNAINESNAIQVYNAIRIQRGSTEIITPCSEGLLVIENASIWKALSGED